MFDPEFYKLWYCKLNNNRNYKSMEIFITELVTEIQDFTTAKKYLIRSIFAYIKLLWQKEINK